MARLLIVKLGAIGDCVMAVPAAYAMHQAGYEVDWVCSEAVAPVLRLYPWLHVHAVDEQGLQRGGVGRRLRALWGVWRVVVRQRYTLCATLYYDVRYRLMALPVRADRKLALSRTDRRTMLVPGRHHADEYLRILSDRRDSEAPHETAPVLALLLPETVLPETQLPRSADRPRIVLVPGGARNLMRDNPLRRWPVTSYVRLAAALNARGYQVILVGGPDDAWVVPSFEQTEAVNCIGKLSLVGTLSLLDSADVTVSHDTGPLHLAGITRSAIVAIFGPTDPHSFCPQRPGVVALWGGETFACRPCYDGTEFAPCTNNGCVQQVSPASVMRQVERSLAAASEGRTVPFEILTAIDPVELVQL